MNEDELMNIPKFIRRLYKEALDPTNNYVEWSSDGEKIRIIDKEKFIKHTLPKLSKTKEYSTFVRQLNIYGFIKLKNDKNDEIEEYYNCFFKRDEPQLMTYIKRLKKIEKTEASHNYPPCLENSITYLSNSNFRLSAEVAELKEKVEKQERTINGLLEILGKVFRTGIQSINLDNNFLKIKSDLPGNLLGMSNDYSNQPKKDNKTEEKNKKESSFTCDMNDIFF